VLGVGRTDVNNQPIDNPVDVNSNSSTSYLQFTKPVIFSSVESIDFSLRTSRVNNGTSYLGQTLNSNTLANKLTLGASYAAYLNNDWSHAKLTTDVQFTRIDNQIVSIYNDVADTTVGKLTYDAVYQIDENSGWGGKAELNAQPLRTIMPSSDKFVVGMDNVRAYKPGSAIGDTGMSFNLDLYKSIYFEVDKEGTKVMTQPYVFYDNAVVYDIASGNTSQTFKAVGYGMKMPLYAAYKGYSFDLYQAVALPGSANKPSGSRYGFSMNYVY
jgi:hemolysin activation/secretion protein